MADYSLSDSLANEQPHLALFHQRNENSLKLHLRLRLDGALIMIEGWDAKDNFAGRKLY